MSKRKLKGKEFEAMLADILDELVRDPAWERACKVVGGFTSKIVWTWIKRSGEGDPKFLVAWPDRELKEKIQLVEGIALARRLHKVKMDSNIRSAVSEGIPEIQMHDGEVLYEKDAALLAEWGDGPEAKEAAERIGGVKDFPYKHRMNEEGKLERIPLVLYRPAPAALRQHVIRSLLPSEYNPPEVRSISTEHSGAVLIMGANRPAYAKDFQPPMTPLRQSLQEKLAELKARGPQHKHAIDAHGRKMIPKISDGSSSNDPPEKNGYGPTPQIDADGHVVGTRVKPMIGRNGVPAPGGFSATFTTSSLTPNRKACGKSARSTSLASAKSPQWLCLPAPRQAKK